MTVVSRPGRQQRRAGKTVAVLLIPVTLFGCAQNGGLDGAGQKETAGTGIGAAAGALGGMLLARTPGGKMIAGLAGATIGGFIGNRIGASLDQQDQKTLQEKARQALLNQPDNVQTHWASDHSGATATVVPENTRIEERQVKIVRSANVASAGKIDFIGAGYQVKSSTIVRLEPSSKSAVATTLPRGSTIWAVGKVHDEPWIMVSKQGQSIGYVPDSNIIPASQWTAVASTSKNAKAAVTEASYRSTAAASLQSSEPATFNLDSSAPIRTPMDLDSLATAPHSTAKVDTVMASVTCRDLKTMATAQGVTETSKKTVCKSPDGSWDIE